MYSPLGTWLTTRNRTSSYCCFTVNFSRLLKQQRDSHHILTDRLPKSSTNNWILQQNACFFCYTIRKLIFGGCGGAHRRCEPPKITPHSGAAVRAAACGDRDVSIGEQLRPARLCRVVLLYYIMLFAAGSADDVYCAGRGPNVMMYINRLWWKSHRLSYCNVTFHNRRCAAGGECRGEHEKNRCIIMQIFRKKEYKWQPKSA